MIFLDGVNGDHMPYGRRRSTRTRRAYRPRTRTARKVRRTARPRRSYRKLGNRWENPIHQERSYKFKYCDTGYNLGFALNATQTTYKFAGNGPFDPDQSAGGVQPYGWDQVTALYGRYICFGSKIKIYFINDGESEESFQLFLIPSRNDVPLSYHDPNDLRQVPGRKMISWVADSNRRNNHSIMNYCTTRKMFGDEDKSTWNASTSANPGSMWYWLLIADRELSGNVDARNLRFGVEITYYVRLYHDQPINES